MIYAKYLQLLQWLCRRELKKITKSYPNTREELIRYHDFMAIGCVDAENPARDRLLGISVGTARMLEKTNFDSNNPQRIIQFYIKEKNSQIGEEMIIEKFAGHEEQMAKLGKHSWNILRLIGLSKDLTVMNIPLDHLNVYDIYEKLTLREMAMHINAVNDADLNFPIILDEDGEIMDGRHRIMKAMVRGEKFIKAVRFDKNPVPCRSETDASQLARQFILTGD